MTETPGSTWSAARTAPEFPEPADWRHHGQIIHVFTHFRLELDVWSTNAADPAGFSEGWWADPRELDAEALPTVFRKVLAAAGLE
jgi:A/G-specific adenine glycosylase